MLKKLELVASNGSSQIVECVMAIIFAIHLQHSQ